MRDELHFIRLMSGIYMDNSADLPGTQVFSGQWSEQPDTTVLGDKAGAGVGRGISFPLVNKIEHCGLFGGRKSLDLFYDFECTHEFPRYISGIEKQG